MEEKRVPLRLQRKFKTKTTTKKRPEGFLRPYKLYFDAVTKGLSEPDFTEFIRSSVGGITPAAVLANPARGLLKGGIMRKGGAIRKGITRAPKLVKTALKASLKGSEKINGITRTQAGKMMKMGDKTVLKHIRIGLERGHDRAQMQDAIRNQMMDEIANTPKRLRKKVSSNIKKLEPLINELLK